MKYCPNKLPNTGIDSYVYVGESLQHCHAVLMLVGTQTLKFLSKYTGTINRLEFKSSLYG